MIPNEPSSVEEELAYTLGCTMAYRFMVGGLIAQISKPVLARTVSELIRTAEQRSESPETFLPIDTEFATVYRRASQHPKAFKEGFRQTTTSIVSQLKGLP